MKRNSVSLPGLMFVLGIHGALLYFLFKQELIPPPEQLATLLVNFIPSPKPKEEAKPEPPPPAPKPQPVKKPQSRQLVAEAPVISKSEPVAPPPPPLPQPEAEPEPKPAPIAEAPPQMSPGPVTLSAELSVACPELNAPAYPALSRRLGEEGKLVLRVELDESGRVKVAQVVDSSGFKRLDEAAMVAVKTWRCNPPQRNGQPVRAIALQPFNFVLQGD
ncbi:outer membrane transport energization protein TonB [Nitrosospira sp. Nl5]|uniref:energy transducer TonB n=1 Tax=Nitrosospira sp. Nl5 TaxID=200120 RepID=UPI00087F881C|nr:energy transducer TonB [Nitrosospira sp. Nl5]SCY69341.1 outer membrane transport energization protein TonB [Nitrosospira sp. Nl5]